MRACLGGRFVFFDIYIYIYIYLLDILNWSYVNIYIFNMYKWI